MNHDTLLTITERTALLETVCTARLHADGEHAFRGACVVSVDLDQLYAAVEQIIAARRATEAPAPLREALTEAEVVTAILGRTATDGAVMALLAARQAPTVALDV